MLAVIINVPPKECIKIATGKKTIDIRGARPTKATTPFKAFIYCCKGGRHPSLTLPGGQRPCNGKVIGEFTCHVSPLTAAQGELKRTILKRACEASSEHCSYKSKYAWHISDLTLYDPPKELSEFGLKKPKAPFVYVEYTAAGKEILQ